MSVSKVHVYMMPGMAANPSIFKHIKLPAHQFEQHLLEWFVPDDNMSLSAYAQKMCSFVKHEPAVLLGVSFGGMLVQEMAKYIQAQKVIVVSSVTHESE